jgi:cell division protein FtsB
MDAEQLSDVDFLKKGGIWSDDVVDATTSFMGETSERPYKSSTKLKTPEGSTVSAQHALDKAGIGQDVIDSLIRRLEPSVKNTAAVICRQHQANIEKKILTESMVSDTVVSVCLPLEKRLEKLALENQKLAETNAVLIAKIEKMQSDSALENDMVLKIATEARSILIRHEETQAKMESNLGSDYDPITHISVLDNHIASLATRLEHAPALPTGIPTVSTSTTKRNLSKFF